MPRPIKILHVFSRMGLGGAELRTLEVFRHIDRRQYVTQFCAISGLEGELDAEIRALGGRVHLLGRRQIGFSARFRRLLQHEQFDVVHTHMLNYSGYILRLAAQCGVPVRVALFRSSQDGKPSGLRRRIYRRLMRRWIDRHATKIEAVSEGAMEAVWGAGWQRDPRCEVIFDGLDPSRFQTTADGRAVRRQFGFPTDAPLCIHVGRMARPKNHVRLLAIFARLLERKPDARLLLVGRGGNRIERDVRRRIGELGIDGQVRVCGECDDVSHLLLAADVMVFPSLWEGLPGAVLEACAAGTPVVASDLPGVREIAARLPRVEFLPLSAHDRRWADVVGKTLEQENAPATRRETQRAFAASEFDVTRCAAAHCRVWQGGRSEPAAVHSSRKRRSVPWTTVAQ